MRLVSASHISDLTAALADQSGLRVASVDTTNDPFDFARTGAALVDRAVAFSSPDGLRLAGLGTAWRVSASGPDRFASIDRALAELPNPGTKAFLGFSFLDEPHESSVWEGFDAAEAFVPRIAIEGTESGARITVAVPEHDGLEPTLDLLASMRKPEWTAGIDVGDHATESHPPTAVWKSQVVSALKEIDAGAVSKVVLARSVVVKTDEPPAILRMFRELARSYPQCYNFAWKSGDSVFMGASPELLASVEDRRFHANPLAGSAPRGEGSDHDDEIGQALLSSPKDLHEHAFVVADMTERLAPISDALTASSHPVLKKMASVQHLSSELHGTLRHGMGLLDAIAAVHPTPAVGGVPVGAAVDLIERTEDIDRGWYTGGVGWVNGNGDGAAALGLRCGLVRGTSTHLFAGAGIVRGSEPDLELEETRLKLVPLLRLLTAS